MQHTCEEEPKTPTQAEAQRELFQFSCIIFSLYKIIYYEKRQRTFMIEITVKGRRQALVIIIY